MIAGLLWKTAGAGAGSPSQAELAERIYRTLARAAGDSRQPPFLEIRSEAERSRGENGRRVAWYDPGSNRIGIDEKVLQLCAAMGSRRSEACVALFLGHELAHFYKDHRWGADFGSRFAGLGVARRIQERDATPEQVLAYETQADEAGGIYGYVAGYDTLGVAEQALASVYYAYGLGAQLQGYPTLPDRQKIARKSAENLTRLLPLFEAGNLLFILGEYEEAGRAFDRVATDFPSREILNNAAVARAVEAASLFPKEQQATAYPWSLDGETRMALSVQEKARGGPGEPPDMRRARLLDEARERLEDTVRRDPDYAVALVNLACVEELRGRRGTASDIADSAIDLATRSRNQPLVKLARLARAIAHLHGEQPEKGRLELAALGDSDDPLLLPWLGGTAAKNVGPAKQGDESKSAAETISGLRAAGVVIPSGSSEFALPSQVPGQPSLVIRSKWSGSYRGLLIQIGTKRISAIITSGDYAGRSSRGVVLNSPRATVVESYGAPDRLLSLGFGAVAVYEQPGLIICTSQEDKVYRWMLFASSR